MDRQKVSRIITEIGPEIRTWSKLDPIEPGYKKLELYIPNIFPEEVLKGNNFMRSIDATLSKSNFYRTYVYLKFLNF